MDQIEEKSFAASALETIKTVVYALLIAGVFRTLFFQPFWIPSGSMKDTLLIGDFLFVNKMAYGYSYASCPKIQIPRFGLNIDADDFCGFLKDSDTRIFGADPKRGDVVVFRHPVTGADYIKRLIGLPGDKVQMQAGVVLINATSVEIEPTADFVEIYEPQGSQRNRPICANGAVGLGADCIKKKYIETLPNGVSHGILDTIDQDAMLVSGRMNVDSTKVYFVPEGHFFFMGDNRDNSSDSRVSQSIGGVGFVPLKDIVGRADRIMFSSAGNSILAFWTWRSNRYFKAVN
jgi:signal peptidase I